MQVVTSIWALLVVQTSGVFYHQPIAALFGSKEEALETEKRKTKINFVNQDC